MASVSSQITINQPVERVFGYITGGENQKTWQAGILDVKVTPPGPLAVGSIYHYTTEVLGRRMETQLKITALEPNKKWAITTTGVPRPVETVYLFEGTGNTTQMTISMELSGGYPAAAEGMVKQQMQKSLDDQCHRIKQLLEK